MNNLDRMKLIMLATQDLNDAVIAYEKARKVNPETDDVWWNLPRYHTRESIRRRINQLRQDLLQIWKEYEHGHA